jgi:hypothetical protein
LWIEEIPPDRFYLCVGLGRKASGSYYTPHSFVRFLVQETLGPQVEERSPPADPKPLEILKLKVLDPAMGSGHFLVEACRFLGEKLYEACRLCDERALDAERKADAARTDEARQSAHDAALEWRQRIIDLPDPDDELAKLELAPRANGEPSLEPVAGYLPSKSLLPGTSTARAQALCRRLVATHCLYGVDKNPLAVELAKLALWLESHAEGMPLTFLDHRLVLGDSLTGPFWDKLLFRPGKPDTPIEDLFSQGLYRKLPAALTEALSLVRRLEASVGTTLAEIQDKEAVKARLDKALLPFRIAVAAWAGGVMLGPEQCDDAAYGQLLKAIGETGRIPEIIDSERLQAQIARGLGLDSIPADRPGLEAAANSAQSVPALAYDLTFPEVFYPLGTPHGRQGFHAVLGNPPWDRMLPADKEFFAAFEFAVLNAPTKRERKAIQDRLLADPMIRAGHESYLGDFRATENILDKLYEFQIIEIDGEKTIGKQDAFRAFMERDAQLVRPDGWIGVVVPSAFHANEGATGIRRLYLDKLNLRTCYSFENRRKLFEIDSRFKFAAVVARAGMVTESTSCAFYLHDDEWLFGDINVHMPLTYKLDFIRRTGGAYLSFLEIRSPQDLHAAETCAEKGETFRRMCERLGIRLGRELNSSDDSPLFIPTHELIDARSDPRLPDVAETLRKNGFLILHEGRTFHQFTDRWDERNRYCVPIDSIRNRPLILDNTRFFRVSYRKISASTNERTAIFALLPPGVTGVDYSPSEQTAGKRPSSSALTLMATANSFAADFCLRLYVSSATVNYFFLARIPLPNVEKASLPVHGALRLSCNHAGYAPLWHEQLGEAWREHGKPPFTWPVLATDDERWHVRAAIDAVVADAYGLARDQYAHVLSTFKHTSYPKAPELCLAMFDELKEIGLEVFSRKYDPYWDIPLNEDLPQPVIDLPIPQPSGKSGEAGLFGDLAEAPRKKRKDSRKRR